MTAISELQQRFAAIDARLQAVEAIAATCIRFNNIIKRITALEQAISEVGHCRHRPVRCAAVHCQLLLHKYAPAVTHCMLLFAHC